MISAGLQAQINRVDCLLAGVKGTGTHNCSFNFQRTSLLVFTPQGFEYEEAFSIAYLQQLQQEGKAVVLAKCTAVEDLTAEDNEVTDAGSNIITTAGKSPYTRAFTFKNGNYFDQAIRTLEGFGTYDVIYLDEKLSILYTSTETYVKGFTVGMIAVAPIKDGNGADTSMSKLKLQELYRSERDNDGSWTVQAQHDIRLASLDGINDAIVEITTIPVDGATTIQFTVKTKADRKNIDLGGIVPANLEMKVGATTKTITGSSIPQDSTTKIYTATFTGALAEDDVVTLRLNDSAFTTGIIKKGGRLYKSNTDSVTTLG
jgi:hypothetical protein